METPTTSSGRRSYLPVDTKGHCFLCLSRLEGSSMFQSHYPLQYLSHYLKMNVVKISGGREVKGPNPPSLSRMVVALCEECASVNEDFADLQQQLEQIEINIGKCLQRIHSKLEGAEAEETGFREENLSWKEDVKFVLGLRQEVMEKCSQKLCGVLTKNQEESTAVKSTSERNLQSTRSKTRSVYAQKVIPIPVSNPETLEEPELEIGEEDGIKIEVAEDNSAMDDDGDLENFTTEFDGPESPQSNAGNEELEDGAGAEIEECEEGEMKEVETQTKGLKVFPGGRKRYTITYRGYIFAHHSDRADNNRITRCTRHLTGCRVRLHLNRSWTQVISESPESHNHPPEEAKCEQRYARWKIRSAAKASCAESVETIIAAAMDGPPDLNQGPFKKLPTLKRYVHRALKSEQNRTGVLPQSKPKTTVKLSTLCEHCGKKFKQRGQLLAHVRSVHLRMRDYQCDLCGKGFYDKRGLLRHRQAIHFGNGRGKAKQVTEDTTDADAGMEAVEIGPA